MKHLKQSLYLVSLSFPGLQYMDDVDPGGVADMAGIRKGDFLLEVNTYQTALSQFCRNLYKNPIHIVMAIFKPKPMTRK